MAIDNFITPPNGGYLLFSDNGNFTVYSLQNGFNVSVDTGRGGPDISNVYSGTDSAAAKNAEVI
jgi:hypothetical protein